jgi:hypothetical protein
MCNCIQFESFAGGHSEIILMNFTIPLIVKRLKWLLKLGWFYEKYLILMDFTNEF